MLVTSWKMLDASNAQETKTTVPHHVHFGVWARNEIRVLKTFDIIANIRPHLELLLMGFLRAGIGEVLDVSSVLGCEETLDG